MALAGQPMSTTCDVALPTYVRGWWSPFLATLPLLSLFCLTPAPARAVSGFSGTFSQSTWTVVNTDPYGSLGGTAGICIENGGSTNTRGCTTAASSGNVQILGTEDSLAVPPPLPDVTAGVPNTTSVILTNTVTETNFRPYVINFNWSFLYQSDNQYVSFSLSSGTLIVDGTDYGTSWNSTSESFSDSTASVYLPPGATLSFSVTTDNIGGYPTLGISNFDAVEIPAPLPLAGASSAFLWSRRLRRRHQQVGFYQQAWPLSGLGRHGSGQTSPLPSQRRALERYAELIGRPLPAGGPALRQRRPMACNDLVSKSNSR